MIRPLREDDLPEALALLDDAIGAGWFAGPDLRAAPGRLALVAEDGGRVAGLAGCRVLAVEELARTLPAPAAEPFARFAASRPAAADALMLTVAAVAPSHRGRGLYAAMLAARLEWGAAAGAGVAAALGWSPPDGCHIEGSVLRAGFARLAEVPGPVEGFSGACPYCGESCRCDYVLFARRLSPPGAAPAPSAGGR
jgi:GNAT superfamily N-acetyltransferase